MYFVEIKDISLNTGKKIEIVKNGYVPMIKRTK